MDAAQRMAPVRSIPARVPLPHLPTRMRSVRIKSAHDSDEPREPSEPHTGQLARLQARNRGLCKTARAREVALGPSEPVPATLDHVSNDLPAPLDIRVSIPSIVGVPCHPPTIAAGAHPAVTVPGAVDHAAARPPRMMPLRCICAGWCFQRRKMCICAGWCVRRRKMCLKPAKERPSSELSGKAAAQSSSEYARSVRKSAKRSSSTSRSSRSWASARRPSPAPPSLVSSSSRIVA